MDVSDDDRIHKKRDRSDATDLRLRKRKPAQRSKLPNLIKMDSPCVHFGRDSQAMIEDVANAVAEAKSYR